MQNNFSTPILFLIFNRPETTQQVFNKIKEVKPRQLFIAADGPRQNKENEKELCIKTREITKQIDWDCDIKTLFREENLGCDRAVSEAITWFFDNIEEGIILEDDCVPTKSFFFFCEEMLKRYKNNNGIGMISGTNYLFGYDDSSYSYYFSKHCYVWGWATWRRAWKLYDPLVLNGLSKKDIREYFKNRLISDYYIDQFDYFKHNKIDTWDVPWSASFVKNNLLSIIPINNQISNIGIDGTHTEKNIPKSINMAKKRIDLGNIKHPPIITNEEYLDLISIKNIVNKIVKKNLLKSIIIKIFKRKNISLIRKKWPFKLYDSYNKK